MFLDYYTVLELRQNACNLDIRQAYRRQALKWHPDKNPDKEEEATQKFKEISEAYQVLGDWVKRRDHDYDLRKYYAACGGAARRSSTSSYSSAGSNSSDSSSDSGSTSSSNFEPGGSTSSNFEQSTSSAPPPPNSGGSSYKSSKSESKSSAPPPPPPNSNFGSSSSESGSSPSDSGRSSGGPSTPPNYEYHTSTDSRSSQSSANFDSTKYNFKNPYDVFEEFFGSRVFAKTCSSQDEPFGMDFSNQNKFGNWPAPPDFFKNDKVRRCIVKEMVIMSPDGNMTTMKTKTVTVRKNGRETSTVSTGFENGILRTTSIKDVTGSQMTTFH